MLMAIRIDSERTKISRADNLLEACLSNLDIPAIGAGSIVLTANVDNTKRKTRVVAW